MNNFSQKADLIASAVKRTYPNARQVTVFNDNCCCDESWDWYKKPSREYRKLDREIERTERYLENLKGMRIQSESIEQNPVVAITFSLD